MLATFSITPWKDEPHSWATVPVEMILGCMNAPAAGDTETLVAVKTGNCEDNIKG